jgi:hypothetical protein
MFSMVRVGWKQTHLKKCFRVSALLSREKHQRLCLHTYLYQAVIYHALIYDG